MTLKRSDLKQLSVNLDQLADYAEKQVGDNHPSRRAVLSAVADLREVAHRFLEISHTTKDIS